MFSKLIVLITLLTGIIAVGEPTQPNLQSEALLERDNLPEGGLFRLRGLWNNPYRQTDLACDATRVFITTSQVTRTGERGELPATFRHGWRSFQIEKAKESATFVKGFSQFHTEEKFISDFHPIANSEWGLLTINPFRHPNDTHTLVINAAGDTFPALRRDLESWEELRGPTAQGWNTKYHALGIHFGSTLEGILLLDLEKQTATRIDAFSMGSVKGMTDDGTLFTGDHKTDWLLSIFHKDGSVLYPTIMNERLVETHDHPFQLTPILGGNAYLALGRDSDGTLQWVTFSGSDKKEVTKKSITIDLGDHTGFAPIFDGNLVINLVTNAREFLLLDAATGDLVASMPATDGDVICRSHKMLLFGTPLYLSPFEGLGNTALAVDSTKWVTGQLEQMGFTGKDKMARLARSRNPAQYWPALLHLKKQEVTIATAINPKYDGFPLTPDDYQLLIDIESLFAISDFEIREDASLAMESLIQRASASDFELKIKPALERLSQNWDTEVRHRANRAMNYWRKYGKISAAELQNRLQILRR